MAALFTLTAALQSGKAVKIMVSGMSCGVFEKPLVVGAYLFKFSMLAPIRARMAELSAQERGRDTAKHRPGSSFQTLRMQWAAFARDALLDGSGGLRGVSELGQTRGRIVFAGLTPDSHRCLQMQPLDTYCGRRVMPLRIMLSGQSKYGHPPWIESFLEGENGGLEACYREYFDVVDAAVGSVLGGADRDTAVHEVFYKLITRPDVRSTFSGRSLSGWLRTVARNHALDFARRRDRELTGMDAENLAAGRTTPHPDGAVGARQVIDRLRKTIPGRLQGVFEKRFIEQRSQREAAADLGVPRTTLVYYEAQVRRHIHKVIAEIEP